MPVDLRDWRHWDYLEGNVSFKKLEENGDGYDIHIHPSTPLLNEMMALLIAESPFAIANIFDEGEDGYIIRLYPEEWVDARIDEIENKSE